MSQGPLCPNLTKKGQAEVSQMANRNLSRVILLGGLSVNLNHLKMLNMDASMSAAICNFYTCINVCVCMCVHACACACVWGHPSMPPDAPHPPAPSPEPQGAQNTKIQ